MTARNDKFQDLMIALENEMDAREKLERNLHEKEIELRVSNFSLKYLMNYYMYDSREHQMIWKNVPTESRSALITDIYMAHHRFRL